MVGDVVCVGSFVWLETFVFGAVVSGWRPSSSFVVRCAFLFGHSFYSVVGDVVCVGFFVWLETFVFGPVVSGWRPSSSFGVRSVFGRRVLSSLVLSCIEDPSRRLIAFR